MARRRTLLPLALILLTPILAQAQTDSVKAQQMWESIQWIDGPGTGQLGREATVTVPAECRFTEKQGAQTFMELTENPPEGNEMGLLLCQTSENGSPWFVIFGYDASGYVKDDEADDLDADALLASIRRGTDRANEIRQEEGWGTLTINGWIRPPYYDKTTNNLTWSIRATDSDGSGTVNHSVRLLGRGGVMNVDLVIDPEDLDATLPVFDNIIAGYTFVPGRTYAEWRSGDKVAAYGLTALVAGGAGALAAKSGLFGKLWKLIAVAIVAVGSFFKRLFGRKDAATSTAT